MANHKHSHVQTDWVLAELSVVPDVLRGSSVAEKRAKLPGGCVLLAREHHIHSLEMKQQ